MPENSVKIILEAEDKTKEALNGLKTNAESMFASIKTNWLELTAGAASIYGVIKSLESFVDAGAKAEQVTSRMAFQISATGINYEKVKPAIDAFAESLRMTTRFSEETTREGLGKMMQYTDDLGLAMKNIKLAMDMSTQSSRDFESCIRYIGFAMNGDIEILGKLLPEFKNLGTTLGDNATKAEKAAYAFEIWNKLYSGASPKDVQTYAGAVQQLSNEYAQLKIVIGETMLGLAKSEPVQGMIDKLIQLSGVLSAMPGPIGLVGKGLLLVNAAFEAQKTKAQEAADKLKEAMKAVEEESANVAWRKPAEEGIKALADWYNQIQEKGKPMFDPLENAFEVLGVQSTEAMKTMRLAITDSLEYIKAAFEKSAVYPQNYLAALKAAIAQMKTLVPDQAEQTKKLVDLQIQLDEKIKAISPDDPERKKKIAAYIDDWIKAKNEVYDQFKTPTQIKIDITKAEATVARLKEQVQALFDLCKSGGNIQMQISGVGGTPELGASVVPSSKAYYPEGPQSFLPEETSVNVSFTGEGSTKKPLNEKIQEIIDQWGGFEKATQSLQAMVNFSDLATQYKNLEAQLKRVQDYIPTLMYISRKFPGMSGNFYTASPTSQLGEAGSGIYDLQAQAKTMEEDLSSQISQIQMKQLLEMMNMIPSYQSGISFVPKTGLAIVHRGEEIRSRGSVSMGGITIGPFHITGASDAKEVANQVVRAFKYRLKGELNDLFK